MLSNRRRKEIGKLTRKKYREQMGELLVEGVRSVEAAVAAGAPLVEILVTAAARAEERVQAVLQQAEVPVHEVNERVMADLSDVQTAQGVLAVTRTVWQEEAVLDTCRTVLTLDAVQDPGNAGALLRTAAWFGAGAMLAGPGTVDLFNPKVVRAAMGGLWDLRLVKTDDLAATLARRRAAGALIYGADLEGTPAGAWQPQVPSVLVLGSEAHGISPEVRRHVDECIFIPSAPRRRGAESLNVAVAAGILVYEWLGAPR